MIGLSSTRRMEGVGEGVFEIDGGFAMVGVVCAGSWGVGSMLMEPDRVTVTVGPSGGGFGSGTALDE